MAYQFDCAVWLTQQQQPAATPAQPAQAERYAQLAPRARRVHLPTNGMW